MPASPTPEERERSEAATDEVTGRTRPGCRVVHLRPVIRLTKAEAFAACQALADADRALQRAGHRLEASALAALFELLETRLCRPDGPTGRDGAQPAADPPGPSSAGCPSGSYSSEREFTQ
jgi:hypothetical protein